MDAAEKWQWTEDLNPLLHWERVPDRGRKERYGDLSVEQRVNVVALVFIKKYDPLLTPSVFESMHKCLFVQDCNCGNTGKTVLPDSSIEWTWKLDVEVIEVPDGAHWEISQCIRSVTLTLAENRVPRLKVVWNQDETPPTNLEELERAVIAMAVLRPADEEQKQARTHRAIGALEMATRFENYSKLEAEQKQHLDVLAHVITTFASDRKKDVDYFLQMASVPTLKTGESPLKKILLSLAALLVLAGAAHGLRRYRQRMTLPRV